MLTDGGLVWWSGRDIVKTQHNPPGLGVGVRTACVNRVCLYTFAKPPSHANLPPRGYNAADLERSLRGEHQLTPARESTQHKRPESSLLRTSRAPQTTRLQISLHHV